MILGDHRRGGLGLGIQHGGFCVGCSWVIMAALFALGVMNLTWMAVVAALIVAERLLPRPAPLVVALILAGLAVSCRARAGRPAGVHHPRLAAAARDADELTAEPRDMTAQPEHLHDVRFPDESEEYRQARDALLHAEKDLRDRTEELARQRRELPLGGVAPDDYEFQEWDTRTGSRRAVTLSELFEDGKDTLFLYSFMFIAGPDGDPIGSPCPNCTSIIDAVAGQARHLTQRINLAVSAKAPIEHFRAHAHGRGWADIRLLSSGENSFNRDYGAEDQEGRQWPYWNILDCTPEGRPEDNTPRLEYR